MQNLPIPNQYNQIQSIDTAPFENYLKYLGLPADNVIAPLGDRENIKNNLEQFILKLNPNIRKNARYLSKFVAGAAIGLFDASLNYIWNEVVLALRKKAVSYGLDLFFDAAVGGNNRDDFKVEDDLAGLKDNTLINTCKKLELISDILHTKLLHILTMRNDIGASHPNSYSINAFELLGWLQTCITEVLNEEPSPAAINVRIFIHGIKSSTDTLSSSTIESMKISVNELSLHNTNNLLNTLFSIYTENDTNEIVRKNISMVAPFIWAKANDEIKFQLGIRLNSYKTNIQTEKQNLAESFFEICEGNKYKTIQDKVIELNEHLDNLLAARYGHDNYHSEPPHMRKILSYISSANDIPDECAQKLLKIILICRVGKGCNYQEGVSPNGKPLYDRLFSMIGDKHIPYLLVAMHSPEIANNLKNPYCHKHMVQVLHIVQANIINERLKEIFTYLENKSSILDKIHHETQYRKLTENHIKWG